jgi:hypothetical protein
MIKKTLTPMDIFVEVKEEERKEVELSDSLEIKRRLDIFHKKILSYEAFLMRIKK